MIDNVGTVISGWVARDADSRNLFFYKSKPIRLGCMWSTSNPGLLSLDPTLFPDLTWDDDPIAVELIIKRKKK